MAGFVVVFVSYVFTFVFHRGLFMFLITDLCICFDQSVFSVCQSPFCSDSRIYLTLPSVDLSSCVSLSRLFCRQSCSLFTTFTPVTRFTVR